jgi:hypothetical protein
LSILADWWMDGLVDEMIMNIVHSIPGVMGHISRVMHIRIVRK